MFPVVSSEVPGPESKEKRRTWVVQQQFWNILQETWGGDVTVDNFLKIKNAADI